MTCCETHLLTTPVVPPPSRWPSFTWREQRRCPVCGRRLLAEFGFQVHIGGETAVWLVGYFGA